MTNWGCVSYQTRGLAWHGFTESVPKYVHGVAPPFPGSPADVYKPQLFPHPTLPNPGPPLEPPGLTLVCTPPWPPAQASLCPGSSPPLGILHLGPHTPPSLLLQITAALNSVVNSLLFPRIKSVSLKVRQSMRSCESRSCVPITSFFSDPDMNVGEFCTFS